MPVNIEVHCVDPSLPIGDAVVRMDANRDGIVLVVDEGRRLLGTVTDGDIRRAILAHVDFTFPVEYLLSLKAGTKHAQPISAFFGADLGLYRSIFREHSVLHLPLLNSEGRVVDLVTASDLFLGEAIQMRAVVMAGGLGSRLRPLTGETPKPMLPLNNRPILEYIFAQLQEAGIKKVNVTTHYKGEMIAKYFGNGENFGIDIRYVKEDQPLGTAGALSLIEKSPEPLLVINGDIVTQVNFRRMLEFHREHGADMTIAVRQYDFCVPYGVVETTGVRVNGVVEKPVLKNFINAGIYLLNSDVHGGIAAGEPQDMPDVINRLIGSGKNVICFPVREYWIDIGRIEEYERAQKDALAL